MAKHSIMKAMPYDGPGTLVFWCQRPVQYSNVVTPTDAPKAGGV